MLMAVNQFSRLFAHETKFCLRPLMLIHEHHILLAPLHLFFGDPSLFVQLSALAAQVLEAWRNFDLDTLNQPYSVDSGTAASRP